MKQKELPKPRNPFVRHLMNRPSGVHGKTKKTIRRNEKVVLKKELDSGFTCA